MHKGDSIVETAIGITSESADSEPDALGKETLQI